MIINNLPEYAEDYGYIVVTKVDNEYWFYGAFHDPWVAESVAYQVDGTVICNC